MCSWKNLHAQAALSYTWLPALWGRTRWHLTTKGTYAGARLDRLPISTGVHWHLGLASSESSFALLWNAPGLSLCVYLAIRKKVKLFGKAVTWEAKCTHVFKDKFSVGTESGFVCSLPVCRSEEASPEALILRAHRRHKELFKTIFDNFFPLPLSWSWYFFLFLWRRKDKKPTISGNLYQCISSLHGNLCGASQLGKILICCSRNLTKGRLDSVPWLLIS